MAPVAGVKLSSRTHISKLYLSVADTDACYAIASSREVITNQAGNEQTNPLRYTALVDKRPLGESSAGSDALCED